MLLPEGADEQQAGFLLQLAMLVNVEQLVPITVPSGVPVMPARKRASFPAELSDSTRLVQHSANSPVAQRA
jgi:hypothetical protein